MGWFEAVVTFSSCDAAGGFIDAALRLGNFTGDLKAVCCEREFH